MNTKNAKQCNTFKDLLACAELNSDEYYNAKKYIADCGYKLDDNAIIDPLYRFAAYSSHYKIMLVLECRMSGIEYS